MTETKTETNDQPSREYENPRINRDGPTNPRMNPVDPEPDEEPTDAPTDRLKREQSDAPARPEPEPVDGGEAETVAKDLSFGDPEEAEEVRKDAHGAEGERSTEEMLAAAVDGLLTEDVAKDASEELEHIEPLTREEAEAALSKDADAEALARVEELEEKLDALPEEVAEVIVALMGMAEEDGEDAEETAAALLAEAEANTEKAASEIDALLTQLHEGEEAREESKTAKAEDGLPSWFSRERFVEALREG